MVRRIRSPSSERGESLPVPTERGRTAVEAHMLQTPSVPSFAKPHSFFGLPRCGAEDPVPKVDVLLSGVPHDGGAVDRPGSRLAPRAVRDATLSLGGYSDALGIGIWDEIQAADGGDIAVQSGGEAALQAITRRAEAIARSGVVGGFVGGDQTVTLAVLRGIQRAKLKGLSIVHIDACTDTLGPSGQGNVHQHSVLRVALEEGLVVSDGVLQVGIRGPHVSERELHVSVGSGFEIVKMDEVRWDLHAAVSQVRKVVRKGSVYVSVDICALDPAFAPGASTLRPGGMSVWELQQILRALVGAHIVGFDVVEVTPPFDPSGITALAGASVLHEILGVIADTHRSARPAPSSAGRRRGRRLSP